MVCLEAKESPERMVSLDVGELMVSQGLQDVTELRENLADLE